MKNELQPSIELSIVGRIPTSWLLDNMHEFTEEEFYNETLSENDLKKLLLSRSRPSSEHPVSSGL